MSDEITNKNFLKRTYDNLSITASKMGLYKEFVIVILVSLIIFIGFWDKILPLFIQLDKNYLNNITSIVPLFICIIIVVITLCSHFKIFGKNALFGFNHKIVNFNKYKNVIARKIENYKNKLMKIKKLYNQNELTRNKLKTNISNLTKNNVNLNKSTEKLLNDCIELNEKSDKFVNKFIDKTRNTIQEVASKGQRLFKSARGIKEIKYATAKARMELDAKNQAEADRWNAEREKLIIEEKNRREKVNHAERLKRVRKAQEKKTAWVAVHEKALNAKAITENVTFYRHRSHSVCALQPPGMLWVEWGAIVPWNHMHCGHDEVSAITVPQFAVLDVWEGSGKWGRSLRLHGGPNGSKHYDIYYLMAHGFNDVISSSHVQVDGPKLTAHINALKAIPLSRFGINLVVEGAMAPGIDGNTTEVPSGWNPAQP